MHSHAELVSGSKISSHTKRFFASAQNDGDNQTYRHTEALAEVSNKQNSNKRFFSRQLPQNDYTSALALNGTPLRSRPLLVQAQNDHIRPKAAFTLAEVLITLGIIGIVAAMTIPNLVAKYKQRMFVYQWRKTYSELANALKLMQENDDVISLKNLQGDTEYEYASVLGKYLKTGVICKENRFVIDGCSPEKYPIYVLSGKKYWTGNFGELGGGSTCMTLLNGSIICFDSFIVYVDVNGFSKPNTIGKDIYSALIRFETYEIRPAIGLRTGWGTADGKFIVNDLGDGTCKPTNNDYGWGCSSYYMHNLP